MPARTRTPSHNLKTTRAGKVKRRGFLWRWRRAFFLLGIVAVVGFAGVAWVLSRVQLPPSDPPQLQTSFICTSEVQQNCSDGNAIATLHGAVNRVEIKNLDEVPQTIQHAVLAAEDKNFFKHGGVDPVGIGRAVLADLTSGSKSQGGSTITQQYVRNVYLNQARTWTRKIKEAVLAVKIEQKLSKKEIFRRYLNTVYFGRGAYGISAAAQAYFGDSDLKQVTPGQAAFLAGIIRAPGTDPTVPSQTKYATDLRRIVLDAMVKQKWVSAADAQKALAQPVTTGMIGYTPSNGMSWRGGVFGSDPANAAGSQYFVDYVRQQVIKLVGEQQAYGGGLRIYTTLDPTKQQQAYTALTHVLHNLPFGPQPQASLVSVDNNGHIVAMVSGDRPFGTGQGESQVNLTLGGRGGGAPRQPGSTFKAFALADAVKAGDSLYSGFYAPAVATYPWFTDQVNGRTVQVPVKSEPVGQFNLITGIAHSVNNVYVPLIHMLGVDNVRKLAYSMGVAKDKSLDDANEALVLGGGGVAPLDMATAYNTFSNGGNTLTSTGITRIEDSSGKVIWSADQQRTQNLTADQNAKVTYALQQVLISGTAAGKGLGYPAAGKTGTTDLNTDGWFIGFTPSQLTTAVWMGYTDIDPRTTKLRTMPNGIDGGTYPAQIWHDFMSVALANSPHPSFPDPGNLGSGTYLSSPVFGSDSSTSGTSGSSSPSTTAPRGTSGSSGSTSTTAHSSTSSSSSSSTSSTTHPTVSLPQQTPGPP